MNLLEKINQYFGSQIYSETKASGERSVDPVQDIRCVASADDPLLVSVIMDLAEHVAACCISPESAFVEFFGNDHHVRSEFSLRERRPAHQMEAIVRLPAYGAYRYRVVAKILGRTVLRESIYVGNEPQGG